MHRRPLIWYVVHRVIPTVFWFCVGGGIISGVVLAIMFTQTITYANALTGKQAGSDAEKALLAFDPLAAQHYLMKSVTHSNFLGKDAWQVKYLDQQKKPLCIYVWNNGGSGNYHDQEAKGLC